MTISDLAEYLQVSKSSLYKLVQKGSVPGRKVGKHWRFSRALIDGWLTGGSSDRNNSTIAGVPGRRRR
jgi:excisionase family DNA binding protein